jgi:serine/threonine-protein kinase
MNMEYGPIKVLIAEDHAILRAGLRLLLEGQQNVVVIGEAEDGAQAVDMTMLLQPDVVLMDVGMPVMTGIEAAQVIRQQNETAKIIMFTAADDEEHIYASLGAGANGYCLKDTSADRLLAGINMVRAGDLWLDSNIASKVMRQMGGLHQASGVPNFPTATDELTKEELAILHLMVEGLTVSEIGRRLGLSESTVRDSEQSITSKLANLQRTDHKASKGSRQSTSMAPELTTKQCQQCSEKFDTSFRLCPYDGSALADLEHDPLVGTLFADRYEVVRRLGRGGMSVVYKARHIFLKRTVAIKVLKTQMMSDVINARRFRQEAEAASAIRHPNIVEVFDFGLSADGEPYLVMDYIDGSNLDDVIEKEGCLEQDRVIDIFLDTIEGLLELHSRSIIHRDLKPSNIMLFQREGRERACLIDLGIAKLSKAAPDQRLTRAGEVLGSPCYVSPEQAQNQPLDARSDVYSLGCAMYEALCGELPFHGDFPWETMMKHIAELPIPLNRRVPGLQIPEALNAVVMCALEKLPQNRFQSAQDMKHGLMFAKAAPV